MPDNLTSAEWSTFFDLLAKIVDLPMPANEKAALVQRQAIDHGGEAEVNLDEFTLWDFSL